MVSPSAPAKCLKIYRRFIQIPFKKPMASKNRDEVHQIGTTKTSQSILPYTKSMNWGGACCWSKKIGALPMIKNGISTKILLKLEAEHPSNWAQKGYWRAEMDSSKLMVAFVYLGSEENSNIRHDSEFLDFILKDWKVHFHYSIWSWWFHPS